jgi:anthranilate phosphoribosyltransferase
MLDHYINQFRKGHDVASGEAEALFDALVNEQDEMVLTDLLSSWNTKGATSDEIYDLVTIMRKRMKPIQTSHSNFVDIVGTGGSKAKTFNVSTAAAFVIAGAGVPVAKHGNRAASSSAGSADVLTSLGINIHADHAVVERCLNDLGLCFMFAPNYHALSPTLASARRRLGQPTVFNTLGPFCNPASAPHQLIGVSHRDLLKITATVMMRLGTGRSWIVNGENGLDEISLMGKTYVSEITAERVTQFELDAGEYGIAPVGGSVPSQLSVTASAALIHEIFDNKRKGQDAERLVLINAAAAISLAGIASDLVEGYGLAENCVRSGAAKEKMIALSEATNK